MGDIVRLIASGISGLLILYSIIIFIRIILTWFSGFDFGRLYIYLCRITDPYLLWFRRFNIFRAGNIDLSPIVALAVLTIANNIISRISETGKITVGFILALLLSVLWSTVSFIIVFFIIIVALRLIAYLLSANIYSPFWQIVDFISRPIIFNINRFIFRNRIVNYLFGILVTIAVLIVLLGAVGFLIHVIGIPLLLSIPF
jgi:YggT family protein